MSTSEKVYQLSNNTQPHTMRQINSAGSKENTIHLYFIADSWFSFRLLNDFSIYIAELTPMQNSFKHSTVLGVGDWWSIQAPLTPCRPYSLGTFLFRVFRAFLVIVNFVWVRGHVEPGTGGQDGVETITHQLVNIAGEPQVLQVLSLKDTAALTKALAAQGGADVKAEEPQTITSDQ
ncbi:hypothetical protein J6590_047525 [Homalodisca vitripennis]|nr:hypothetical protein J6590_047525 [Homalodisca vitripennis]